MPPEELIPAHAFCTHHRIEVSFLHSLHEYGLVELSRTDNDWFLPAGDLETVERLVRLHLELAVNVEALDVIKNLLHRIDRQNTEIARLKARLRFYEGE